MPRNPLYGDATLEDVACSLFREPPQKGQQTAEDASPGIASPKERDTPKAT